MSVMLEPQMDPEISRPPYPQVWTKKKGSRYDVTSTVFCLLWAQLHTVTEHK